MNTRSAGARPSWPGLGFSGFLEPGRLRTVRFCPKLCGSGAPKNRISGRGKSPKSCLVGWTISKHLIPKTIEFCAVLHFSHPNRCFECCNPSTSHQLRETPVSKRPKTCPKNCPKTVPSPRDAASQNARSAPGSARCLLLMLLQALVGVGGRWQPPFHGYRETLREERPLLGASVLSKKQGPHFCTFFAQKVPTFRKTGHSRAPFAHARRRSAIAVCFVGSACSRSLQRVFGPLRSCGFLAPLEKSIFSHTYDILTHFRKKGAPFAGGYPLESEDSHWNIMKI